MADINIERLTLKLSGISKDDGQHLAQLIAEGLAATTIASEGSRHIDALHVNATATTAHGIDMLSQQIVAQIVRQLESTL